LLIVLGALVLVKKKVTIVESNYLGKLATVFAAVAGAVFIFLNFKSIPVLVLFGLFLDFFFTHADLIYPKFYPAMLSVLAFLSKAQFDMDFSNIYIDYVRFNPGNTSWVCKITMTISEELAVDLYKKYGREYQAGDILFKEGDVAEAMYIVISGKASIVKNLGNKDREVTLAMVEAGEILGEMAIINSELRSASSVIQELSRILVIDRNTFYAMIRNNAEFAMEFLSILSSRLRDANVRGSTSKTTDIKTRVLHYIISLAQDYDSDEISMDELILFCRLS